MASSQPYQPCVMTPEGNLHCFTTSVADGGFTTTPGGRVQVERVQFLPGGRHRGTTSLGSPGDNAQAQGETPQKMAAIYGEI